MTPKLTELINSIEKSARLADEVERDLTAVCEKVYKDALTEHSDLPPAKINQHWLEYYALVLK